MPSYYTYLISSLPMLVFGARSPASFERFLQLCQGLIPEPEVELLKGVSILGESVYKEKNVSLHRWRRFDTALRNELVKIRASRKRLDPTKFLRNDEYVEPAISHIAMNAYRNPSILEGERILDLARWHLLEELSIGHYFDIDFLIIYALKLLILERWERIRSADNSRILEEILK